MNKKDSKKEFSTIKKQGINYLIDKNGKIKKFKPWLGDIFSFLYDRIMEKSIFPKKFNASIHKHFEILKNEFHNIHNKKILEIATGSGNAVNFLNNDNHFIGIDISPELLRKAAKKFKQYEFQDAEFYIADAKNLPFRNDFFDIGICNLSLNFFGDIGPFISELKRVIKKGAKFYCSVPIPERKPQKSKIRGTLYSEKELKAIFEKYGFNFESKPDENGAVLYFTAISKEKLLEGQVK